MEQTLIILKPDAVERGLMGRILSRFEQMGLKIVAAKLMKTPRSLAEKHYPGNREVWLRGMGEKTLENYKKFGEDPIKLLGTNDTHEIGMMIQKWLVDYIVSGPVLAFVVEGPHAVELTRKICGNTLPFLASPGSIRGDLAYDSSYLANSGKRAIKNLVHASGSIEEAKYEIPLWFDSSEIFEYERAEEKVMQ
ncbi:nucleoside-diphosphate kinase [Candidatus Roizmanbacteria bacterium RIFCSPHIGHO2_02_FULL_37_15]|uniref:nucleoside-diphosphate kinase n=1 Tax=Candidatus Roizmanbacteria bacterium RIFCSPLOWO2_01_FULL_37_16 TaxID=1802058 RepID=A0A1F7IJL6_9BACT|nr:MAG: nucleoside-diphosphate kinase [Candidatus Roizmanbacteria bacterium RIFCSPHIGHO2_02_FULL_37_15]OGK34174.1 MAG: nucleoside-diphosphate kinase [Candidatus Roizmanbacteria bacterium RIFCSPHIGHO2_12_FULL_36_11]OGK43554.1 MAG: nucleoside-diphosphate kinase [Candidatus Roizmanbacteria bacterium RIFCSPLOWO2_01_FULL_37_16]